MKATDWTKYYGQKKSWFSKFTQQYTQREIEQVIRKYTAVHGDVPLEILELGGGNSCFAKEICQNFHVKTYNIIDNNDLAAKLFNEMELGAEQHQSILYDLLDQSSEPKDKYDIVFSVGLIEHFRGADIRTVIGQHYLHCKENGCVLITFPTPTARYRIIRKLMELAGMWQFHDEMPLRWRDVAGYFLKFGTVLTRYINWKLPLTQMIVITKNSKQNRGQQENAG